MGSSAARTVMKDGVLVKKKYNKVTKRANPVTFEQLHVHIGQRLNGNAIPFLRRMDDIKDSLRKNTREQKPKSRRTPPSKTQVSGPLQGAMMTTMTGNLRRRSSAHQVHVMHQGQGAGQKLSPQSC